MANQFKDQGGVSSTDPSVVVRWVTSKAMTRMASQQSLARRRAKAERARRRAGRRHRVEYFHQVDDGYSHIAAQLLAPLVEHYDVELVCHLVTAETGANLPEPDLLLRLSRYDAAKVAPHYGLRFPEDAGAPDAKLVDDATRILSTVSDTEFPETAVAIGDALWAGDHSRLQADTGDAAVACAAGNARRAKLGHYSGAMFWYAGEWFWGADRFYHMERALIANGARRDERDELLCPRPPIETGPLRDDGSLTLEIYPSLRSPYTSVIFDTAIDLAAQTGIRLVTHPVLPMVMRGVPATRSKGTYIVSDAAREAAALGLNWGHVYDPIGEPVRNAYSLYPWANKLGKGNELLSSFMRAAFCEGANTNNAAGMRLVVERVGLPWEEASSLMGNAEWEAEIESNRLAMYAFGSWGVPSFRLLDARGAEVLALWGQDRLWLFSREIQRLLREAEA